MIKISRILTSLIAIKYFLALIGNQPLLKVILLLFERNK